MARLRAIRAPALDDVQLYALGGPCRAIRMYEPIANCFIRNSFAISQMLPFSYRSCMTRELPLAYGQVPSTSGIYSQALSSSSSFPSMGFCRCSKEPRYGIKDNEQRNERNFR